MIYLVKREHLFESVMIRRVELGTEFIHLVLTALLMIQLRNDEFNEGIKEAIWITYAVFVGILLLLLLTFFIMQIVIQRRARRHFE